MTLKPFARKLLLVFHSLTSVGLLGSIASFCVIAIAGFVAVDQGARAALPSALLALTIAVVVPFALFANLSGLALALMTPWGLFKYYWVTIKFGVTLFATAVLLVKVRLISQVADCYSGAACALADPRHGELELIVHAATGFLVLLIPLALSIFKPLGRIPSRNAAA